MSSVTDKLVEFSNKARCRYAWPKADRLARELRSELGPAFRQLDIEYNHIKLGERWDAFDVEVKRLLGYLQAH